MIVTEQIERKTVGIAVPSIRKGPMEGILIVDGRQQMECLDMPSISFESILALQRFNEQHPDKQAEGIGEGRQ